MSRSAAKHWPRRRARGGTGGRLRGVLARTAAAVAALCALVVVYGAAVEPRLILDQERIEARLPRLGADWAGAEVTVLSDLQVGMWWDNTGMIERMVAETVAADPEAVLLAGDFVYGRDDRLGEKVRRVTGLLAPLTEAGLPVYAVMGNHDVAVGAVAELTAAFEELGITVLTNEAARLPAPGDGPGLHVVGLGPEADGTARPEPALAEVPGGAPRLVLMHNPTSFPDLPPGSAPLAVAGHTHCGQIALPLISRWSYLGLTEEEELVVEGFAPPAYGARGNRLFVTCGVGFTLLPMRINAPPQLLTVELRPA